MEVSKNAKPRPTASINEERLLLEKQMQEGDQDQHNIDRYLAIMNDHDWTTELFSENGKYGLKKWDGTLLLPAAFDNFRMKNYDHNPGEKVVAKIGDKEGIVRMDGVNWKWTLLPEFDYISYPNNSLIGVMKNNKWGVYDQNSNKYLIPLECDQLYVDSGFIFCNGIGIYRKGDKYGVMNDAGFLTDTIFDEVEGDLEGPVRVRIADRTGYISEDGTFEEDEELAFFYWNI